ncbi:MAG TPA: hypothetical protein VGR16_10685 [Thermomicrobiales bacterium]|nr:hypothetical protein [Thermomicrobiales bacterium]
MGRAIVRLGVLFGLFLLLGTLGVTRTVAGQAEPARLTIHNRICPIGFSGPDYYGTCHDTPPDPGLPFTLSGPVLAEGITDPEGNITFAGLTPGDYAVSGGVPGEFATVNYFCASADTPSQAYPFTRTATGITVSLPAGADVICDWYNTPIDLSGRPTPPIEPATLEVYAAICPVSYEGSSYFDDCFPNAASAGSVTFTLERPGGPSIDQPVGSDGHARFANLRPGTYTLSDSVPGDALDGRFVYCTFDGADPRTYALDHTENAISLTIDADERVACDWYILPADLRGEPVPTATPRPGSGVVVLPDTGTSAVAAPIAPVSAWFTVLISAGVLAGLVAVRWPGMQMIRRAAKIRVSGTHDSGGRQQ